jgi:hypothetical protein
MTAERDTPPRTWRLMTRETVVRRAVLCGISVGALLIAINHGDAILRHEFTPQRIFKMCLTPWVPYFVSTFSSVAAIRNSHLNGGVK